MPTNDSNAIQDTALPTSHPVAHRPVQAARQPDFTGLELDEALRAHDAEARCGLLVVDLRTGDAVHGLGLEGVVEELYDVAVLSGARRPMALGLKTDEVRRTLSLAPPAPL